MNPTESTLRLLPAVHLVLAQPELQGLLAEQGRDTLLTWVRQSLAEARAELLGGWQVDDTDTICGRVVDRVRELAGQQSRLRLRRVINATGVILHTSLGRAPLAAAAQESIRELAAGGNLEVDLDTGDRRYRGYQLETDWRALTGAEDALVVNNNAAATLLALQGLCRDREVIISRGQLIEIGGSFRLPDIFTQSGAILREVGTTNRSHRRDYERAINEQTAAILHVHPSNYRIVGFTQSPPLSELVALTRQRGVLLLDDIGSGALIDVSRFGLPEEPTFPSSIATGADVVLGSGDKLLGGPQAGILVGRRDLIERLRQHPLARCMRIDKLTLAALAATLAIYRQGRAEQEIPTLQLLAASAEDLRSRAERIVAKLALSEWRTELEQSTSPVGGGSLPGAELPTTLITLHQKQGNTGELARRLRLHTPSVFPRIQADRVCLDLRSVLPADDAELIRCVQAVCQPS